MKVIEFLEYVDRKDPITINVGDTVENFQSKEDIQYQLLRLEIQEVFVFVGVLNILVKEGSGYYD